MYTDNGRHFLRVAQRKEEGDLLDFFHGDNAITVLDLNGESPALVLANNFRIPELLAYLVMYEAEKSVELYDAMSLSDVALDALEDISGVDEAKAAMQLLALWQQVAFKMSQKAAQQYIFKNASEATKGSALFAAFRSGCATDDSPRARASSTESSTGSSASGGSVEVPSLMDDGLRRRVKTTL